MSSAPPPSAQRIGSRTNIMPKLAIPLGNLPGSTFDQAGEGGWRQTSSQASYQSPTPHNTIPVQQYSQQMQATPPPMRPSLSLPLQSSSCHTPPPIHPIAYPYNSQGEGSHSRSAIGRAPSPNPLYKLSTHSKPKLVLASLSATSNAPPSNPSSARGRPTPSLSLAIPRLGSAIAGTNPNYPSESNGCSPEYDGAGETSYYGGPRTPLAGADGEQEYLTNRQEVRSGVDKTVTSLPAELRQALSQMRIGGGGSTGGASGNGGSHTPGRQSSADRSGAKARSHNTLGKPDSRRPSIDVENFGYSSAGAAKTGGPGSGNVTPQSGLSRHNSVASSTADRSRRAGGSESSSEYHNRSSSSSDRSGQRLESGMGDVTQTRGEEMMHGREELNPDDYETLERLGEGAGGAVEKVKDKKTGKLMAMKIIPTSPNPAIHKQILRELQFLNDCQSPYIVDHFGSFLTSHDTCIGILMEYCEAGSLDSLVRRVKRLRARTSEKVLGRIAESVLRGLDYLHERRIIHRDIKPSNIVVTKSGQVKLCDFGVSGELVNSMAGTWTGTTFYMAPERIQGMSYSIKSDVWSLGLTLHEVAHNRFPFPPEGEAPLSGPIELLNFIVAQPVPRMIDSPAEKIVWTAGAQDFMSKCLIRDGNDRPYPRDLLKHPWIIESTQRNINMAKWVAAICQF